MTSLCNYFTMMSGIRHVDGDNVSPNTTTLSFVHYYVNISCTSHTVVYAPVANTLRYPLIIRTQTVTSISW
jgi:hypothetical protein